MPEGEEDRTSSSDDLSHMGWFFDSAREHELMSFVIGRKTLNEDLDAEEDGSDEVKVDLLVLNEESGSCQSGHYLWPSARYLCDYLLSLRRRSKGSSSADRLLGNDVHVIEIGCGIGLVGRV